jgi:hypothetical protein
MGMEIFTDQYNEAHKEHVITFEVTINTVLPNNKNKIVTDEQIVKWFEQHMTALQTGLQIQYGNSLHQIKVVVKDGK